jgi:hypothetical protein
MKDVLNSFESQCDWRRHAETLSFFAAHGGEGNPNHRSPVQGEAQ